MPTKERSSSSDSGGDLSEGGTRHAELEGHQAFLPGFKWLSIGSFALGLIETALYGAWAGALYSALYNFFARRAARDAEHRLTTVQAA